MIDTIIVGALKIVPHSFEAIYLSIMLVVWINAYIYDRSLSFATALSGFVGIVLAPLFLWISQNYSIEFNVAYMFVSITLLIAGVLLRKL